MKNRIYLIIVSVILISLSSNLVSAFEVVPPYLNFSTYVGDRYSMPITINNLYQYPLYNVSIASNAYFSLDNIEEIDYNQSKITHLNFSTPMILNNTNISVTFQFYKKENITLQPNASIIIIANSSYNPSAITIVQGSTITWTNDDSIIHNVKDDGGEFNRDIMPGDSFTYQFNNIKNYTYRDRFFGFAGQVFVRSQQQEILVHYSDLDIRKIFMVSATYHPGSYTLNLLTNNISMEYNETKEGVFQIINTGESDLYNIHFSGEWFSFNQNYFDLAPNQVKYITFSIIPVIYSTEQTNQTYNKQITVNSDNANSSTLSVPIFIKYANVLNMNASNAERAFIEWLCGTNVTQGTHPDSFLCNGTQIIYVNRTLYEPPPLWINYSAEDIANIKNASAQAETLVTRFASSQQERDDRLESLNANNTNSISNLSKNLQDTKDKTDNLFILTALVVGVIIAITMCVGGFYIIKVTRNKNNLDYQNRY